MQGLNLTGFNPNWEDKTRPSHLKSPQPDSGNSRTEHVYAELQLIKSKLQQRQATVEEGSDMIELKYKVMSKML